MKDAMKCLEEIDNAECKLYIDEGITKVSRWMKGYFRTDNGSKKHFVIYLNSDEFRPLFSITSYEYKRTYFDKETGKIIDTGNGYNTVCFAVVDTHGTAWSDKLLRNDDHYAYPGHH